MGIANEPFEADYTLDQLVEITTSMEDDLDTPWETFTDQIDAWARHALAANGFGDY